MKRPMDRWVDALLHRGPGYDTPDPGRVQDAVAFRIRAELVCCDLYDRVQREAKEIEAGGTSDGFAVAMRNAVLRQEWHDLCYWGEAAAQIAEGRCPGYETEPSICRCGCEGCVHNCSAHTKWTARG